MAVTISGTNGIAVPLGTAAAPGVVNTTSATTGIYNPTSTTLGLSTNGTNALYIDASQNVGIGTSSPGYKLHVQGGTSTYSVVSTTGGIVANLGAADAAGFAQSGTVSNTPFVLQTNNSERIRIDTSGNVGIGTTSPGNRLHISGATNSVSGVSIQSTGASGRKYTIYSASTGGLYFANDTGGGDQMVLDSSGNLLVGTTSLPIAATRVGISGASGVGVGVVSLVNTSASTKKWSNGPDANGNFIVYNDASVGMYLGYGNNAWTASSDERAKTDLVPIENAAAKVSSLRAVTGRFKTDEEGKSRSFLIAQDVQAVLPEAVDASDPDKLGVQYTDVIPLLVAAIKELSAEVEALKAKVGA